MPNEEYTTLDDLVFSHSFRSWVLKSNSPEAEFWTAWAAKNASREGLVNQAREIILALHSNSNPLSAEIIDAEVEMTLQKLRDGRLNMVREVPFRPSLLGRRVSRYWLAAAVLAVLGILFFLFVGKGIKHPL
jgi:hypothetical protein